MSRWGRKNPRRSDAGRQGVPHPTRASLPELTADDRLFMQVVIAGSMRYCDGFPPDPEMEPFLERFALGIDPRWSAGAPVTPRIYAWFRLQIYEFEVGDHIRRVMKSGITREELSVLQDLSVRGVKIAEDIRNFLGESEDEFGVEGAFLANHLGLMLGASSLVVMGMPTSPKTIDLERRTVIDTPRFANQQAAADYWSDRTLEFRGALQELLDSVIREA